MNKQYKQTNKQNKLKKVCVYVWCEYRKVFEGPDYARVVCLDLVEYDLEGITYVLGDNRGSIWESHGFSFLDILNNTFFL